MTIGERIKIRRRQLELTQTELADLIGSSQRQIIKYEQDENSPTSAVIIAMATALETSADWLLGLSDEINPHYDDSNLDTKERELLKIYRAKPNDKQDSIIAMARVI